MNQKEIKNLLEQLGEMLVALEQKKPIRLMIIGGAFMLTQVGNRETTSDIDAKVLDIADPMHSQDYLTLKNATHFVADENELDYSWFSDTIGDFLTVAGPLPKMKLWLQSAMLEVYIPPTEYIYAHKLLAGRDKDDNDIRALAKKLKVRTRKQAQDLVNSYITNKDLQQQHRLQQKLDRYFPR